MYQLLMGMTRLMAPILSFTADEVWSYLPKGSVDQESVHLSAFPEKASVIFDKELSVKWDLFVQLKGEVSKALELRRREKVIGHSLDAMVTLVLPEGLKKLTEEERNDLRYIFIVSAVEIRDSLEGDDVFLCENMVGLSIRVSPAPGKKCERCWNYFIETELGKCAVCSRCVANLASAKA